MAYVLPGINKVAYSGNLRLLIPLKEFRQPLVQRRLEIKVILIKRRQNYIVLAGRWVFFRRTRIVPQN